MAIIKDRWHINKPPGSDWEVYRLINYKYGRYTVQTIESVGKRFPDMEDALSTADKLNQLEAEIRDGNSDQE